MMTDEKLLENLIVKTAHFRKSDFIPSKNVVWIRLMTKIYIYIYI